MHSVTVTLGKVSHPVTGALALPPLSNVTFQLENTQFPALLPALQSIFRSGKPWMVETEGVPGVEALVGGVITLM
jgi:hypothetical protein